MKAVVVGCMAGLAVGVTAGAIYGLVKEAEFHYPEKTRWEAIKRYSDRILYEATVN